MKKIKKLKFITVMIMSLVIFIGEMGATAEAATWRSKEISGFSYFNKPWEKTVTYWLRSNKKVIGTMTYGYETDWIKEDYVWTKSNEGYTLAEIQRKYYDEELQYGSVAGMNKYSKVEVAHKVSGVKYQIKFFATYGSIDDRTTESSIK